MTPPSMALETLASAADLLYLAARADGRKDAQMTAMLVQGLVVGLRDEAFSEDEVLGVMHTVAAWTSRVTREARR